MTHVFVAPHPDDVALSCGGLIASLRELGQNVTIVTVFSGNGPLGDDEDALTSYQREALGFGSKAHLAGDRSVQSKLASSRRLSAMPPRAPGRGPPTTTSSTPPRPTPTPPPSGSGSAPRGTGGRASATSRSPASRSSTTCRPRARSCTEDVVDAAAAGDLMARRRLEDERFAYFAEASIVFLDLPDAVFRGYEGDDQLLGSAARRRRRAVRAPAPRDRPARAAEGLPPARRRQSRRPPALPRGRASGCSHEGRRWVMPGPEYAGIVVVLRGLPVRLVERLPAARRPRRRRRSRVCPPDVSIVPEYADITDQLERKITGHQPLREPDRAPVRRAPQMADAVRAYGRTLGEARRRRPARPSGTG